MAFRWARHPHKFGGQDLERIAGHATQGQRARREKPGEREQDRRVGAATAIPKR